MNKKLMILAILLVAAIALVGCTPKTPAATATPVPEPTATVEPVVEATPEATAEVAPEVTAEVAAAADNALKGRKADVLVDYTLEELAKFDGKEGRLAYVAVDGIVYDVTDSKSWEDGAHAGFEAGKDLTEEIKKSPHGIEAMDNVIEVGKLVTK